MSIESRADRIGLERAGRTVAVVLRSLRATVRPGITTAEIGAACDRLLSSRAARHAPRERYGFPGAICVSINDEAVHGVPGTRVVRAGDLVKLDLVVEQDGYLADAAVTVAVPPASGLALDLVACARRALERALGEVRAGRPVARIGRAVEREVRRSGFAVLPELCGHGVGRDIHEPPEIPNFADSRRRDVLTEGLVIAVEPIIGCGGWRTRVDPDGWTIRTADGSLSAHSEHTVIVTRGAPIVLTA